MGKSKRLKKIKRKIRYSLVYRLVRFFIFLSGIMPRVAWLRFCGFLGRIAYRFATETRILVKRHLTIAFDNEKTREEINTLAKRVFEYLGKNTGEMLRATKVNTLEELKAFLQVSGMENYEQANKK